MASMESHANRETLVAFTMYSFELGVIFPRVGCDPAEPGVAADMPRSNIRSNRNHFFGGTLLPGVCRLLTQVTNKT
jgi:hypothetical protein